MKFEMKRWNKNRISYIHFGMEDFYDFDCFVIKMMEVLKKNVRYSLLLKINYNNSEYAMAGRQVGFKYLDEEDLEVFEVLHKVYWKLIESIYDNYDVERINSVQLLYVFIEDMPELQIKNVNRIIFNNKFTDRKDSKDRFSFIPLTVDTNYFGKLIINDRSMYLAKINEQKGLLNINSLIIDDSTTMHLYNDSVILSIGGSNNSYARFVYDAKSGVFINECSDMIISENHFVRKIGNVSLTIKNDTIITVESVKVLSPIRFSGKSLKDEANPFIGSWDVEAFNDADGYAKVYALGFAVLGEESKTYYLDGNTTSEQLVLKCLNDMLISKYDGYTFYTHNFGKYDSVFLMKIIKEENIRLGEEYYKTKELYRDNDILKLTIKVKKSLSDKTFKHPRVRKDPGYIKITIVDSLNILNRSLSELCRSFDVPVTKGCFPHSFVKRETLYYVGNTPSYNYWENTSQDEYYNLLKPDWNLKEECLKYLDRDLVSLVLIMDKFSEYVNRKYHLQVTESLTISRLALNIFLKDYLRDSKLPIINKNMFNDIKQAYYGGVTEVYKPHGVNLLHYDVNSLYPFAALNDMPGTHCSFIENLGDTESLNIQDLFGFFYCEIETGDEYLGLLPVHHKEGMIMPNGTWTGWYFSEELKYAAENGYSIKVIKGYKFNRVNDVFTDYVTDLYKIKASTKDNVEKDIAKRLLNHLLGRFGLNIAKPVTKCVDESELPLLFSTRHILGKPVKITDNDYRVTYNSQVDPDICADHGIDYIKVQNLTPKKDVENLNEFKDVSLSTAAVVTAYARIYMSKIKKDILNKGGNIYYTDTDSIVTDIPLDKSLVGEGLGMFKLEYKIKQGYYISNKTYYIDLAEKIYDNNTKGFVSNVIKSKSVLSKSLTCLDFVELYRGNDVEAKKRLAIKDFDRGSVTLVENSVKLHHNSYTKREKVLKGNVWIDTRPLVLGGELKTQKKRSTNLKYSGLVFSLWVNKILGFIYTVTIILFCVLIYISTKEDIFDVFVSDRIESDTDPNLDKILELKYLDDYMEEPVEIELNNSIPTKSLWKDLVNLFMDKGSRTSSIYKDSVNFIENSSLVNITDSLQVVSTDSLSNPCSNERPQVLNYILKNELDLLYEELSSLKNYFSRTELQKLRSDSLVSDALHICTKAIDGVPLNNNNPILRLNTSIERSVLTGNNSPMIGRGATFTGYNSPTLGKGGTLSGYNSPILGKGGTFSSYNSPIAGKVGTFSSYNSPVIGNNAIFSRYNSPIVGKSGIVTSSPSPVTGLGIPILGRGLQ